MSTFQSIVDQQVQWARGAGLSADKRAYLERYEENLFLQRLGEGTDADFGGAAGAELRNRGDEPAKMRALYSSSALVCNVFDYWRKRDPGAIGRALDLAAPVTEVRFEAQLPSGLRGTPPTLDLLLSGPGTTVAAVEGKFTEPYSHGSARVPFADAYFKEAELWTDCGLPGCQEMAQRLRDGHSSFTYLDAPQLLKHALGFRRTSTDGELLLVWYDAGGAESQALVEEIARFSEMVDSKLRFRALTYQEVFASLAAEPQAENTYVAYLRSRYFPTKTM